MRAALLATANALAFVGPDPYAEDHDNGPDDTSPEPHGWFLILLCAMFMLALVGMIFFGVLCIGCGRCHLGWTLTCSGLGMFFFAMGSA